MRLPDKLKVARCSSHRARERLERLIGVRPSLVCPFRLGNHKGLCPIRADEVASVRAVKGVSIARLSEEQREALCQPWHDRYTAAEHARALDRLAADLDLET